MRSAFLLCVMAASAWAQSSSLSLAPSSSSSFSISAALPSQSSSSGSGNATAYTTTGCVASNTSASPPPNNVWLQPVLNNDTALYEPQQSGAPQWTCDTAPPGQDNATYPVSYWTHINGGSVQLNYMGGDLIIRTAQKWDRGYFYVAADNLPAVYYDMFNASATGQEPVYVYVRVNPQMPGNVHKITIVNNGPDLRLTAQDGTHQGYLDIQAYRFLDASASISDLAATMPPYPSSAAPGGGADPNAAKLGALLGGILGAVAAALLIGVSVFWLLRRRRRVRDLEDRRDSYVADAQLEPFAVVPAPRLAGIVRTVSGSSATRPASVASASTSATSSPATRLSTLPVLTPPTEEDEYGTYSEARSGQFTQEATDWAPPSYAQVYSPNLTTFSDTPVSPTPRSPTPAAGPADLRQPVRWTSAASTVSTGSKGWMPSE